MTTNKLSQWEKKFTEFWLPLITTDGKLDIQKIKNELYDWDFVMQQIPLVYDHVTSGHLSKVMYDAQTVITEHDDNCHKYCVDKDDHEEELQSQHTRFLEDLTKIIGEKEILNINDQEWYKYGKERCNNLKESQKERAKQLGYEVEEK